MKMRTKINFIVLVILLFDCVLTSCSQEVPKSKEDIEREKRKGYTEMRVYIKDIEIDTESKELIEDFKFDKEGNILINTKTHSQYKLIYKYNDINRPIEITDYDSDDRKKQHKTIKYNKNSIIFEAINEYYYNDDLFRKTIIKYDDKGNKISELSYQDNKVTSEYNTTNKYNDKNQLVQTITYLTKDSDLYIDTITAIIIYEYDKDGNTILKKYKKGGLSIPYNKEKLVYVIATKYKYNDKGSVIEKIEYDEKCEPTGTWMYEYKYNEKELIIEKATYQDGEPKYMLVYEYE